MQFPASLRRCQERIRACTKITRKEYKNSRTGDYWVHGEASKRAITWWLQRLSYYTQGVVRDASTQTAASFTYIYPHFTSYQWDGRPSGGPLSQPRYNFDLFHLLDLVQGVVVGGHAGVVHLVEPHHHWVAGVGILCIYICTNQMLKFIAFYQ